MSAAGVFQAIPGVNLAENQKTEIWTICLTLAVLGVLFVAVRGISRWTQSKRVPLALDDYLILPALIFSLGTAACALEATKYGGGRHLATLDLADFIGLYKVVYSYTYFWIWSTSFTKFSILAFYKRVFGASIQLWICVAMAVGYFITITVSWALVCRPISYFWMEWITPDAPGYCFDVYSFDLANAIASLVIDAAVLAVPLPTIARLQMPLKQKIGVAVILLLGCFVSVASAIRLKNVVYMNTNTTDISWSMGAVFVWSCVEPFVGIFCACLPTYPPLIRLLWRKFSNLPLTTTLKSTIKSGTNSLSYGKNSRKGGLSINTDENKNGSYGHGSDNKFRGNQGVRRLASEEELGLTNNISGGHMKPLTPMSPWVVNLPGTGGRKSRDEEMGYPMTGITVKKEVDWSSSSNRVDDGKRASISKAF